MEDIYAAIAIFLFTVLVRANSQELQEEWKHLIDFKKGKK